MRRSRAQPPVRRVPSGKAAPVRAQSGKAAPPRAPSGYVLLLGLVAVLNVIGLVMVLSASSVYALREEGSAWEYFLKQSVWLTLGTGAMLVTLRLDYHRWRRLAAPLLAFSVVLLCIVLLPGVGLRVNGARSWLGFGSTLRLQPSELVKFAILLFACDLLARREHRMNDLRVTVRPILAVLAVAAMLMMAQPDLGSTLVMGAIVLAVFFVAGVPLAPLAGMTLAGGFAAVVVALSADYRSNRIFAFLHPGADPGGTGYQINQSLMGVASGRINGVGLGASRAKWGFLPNAHTDFIFAVIGEELGLVGSLLVIGLFGAFALLGMRAALRAPDRFGVLIASGVTAWIITQAVVNLGGAVGVMPITGLTLPFVSYGGSSLVISMAATGILLNVARQGRIDVVSRVGQAC